MQTTTTAAAVKKQFNIGSTESLKNQIAEMVIDFTRPAAVKNAPPIKASEKEMLEILHTVATDRRYKTIPVLETVEINGEEVSIETFDTEGNQVFKTIDLFEEAWEAIKIRDYSETISRTPTIAGLEAQIRKYGKALNLTEETITAMIASAKATQTPAEAATA